MLEKNIGFLNCVSNGDWYGDLKNEENNLNNLKILNSLDLVLYHYYYSQNLLKNTFYRVSCWNRPAYGKAISTLGNPDRWIEDVGNRLINSVTMTINSNPTPENPYMNIYEYNTQNIQNNGTGGINKSRLTTIKANYFNVLKVSSGDFSSMMTRYGWREGTVNDINLRSCRAYQRAEDRQNKKQRAEEMKKKFGDEVADAILGDYDAIPLIIPEDEIVNGYEISARSGEHNFLIEEDYNLLIKIWLDIDKYPNFSDVNSFMKACHRGKYQFCSDWNKMDEFGECFGGYWKYPEGSVEKENAYDLSFRKNILCIYSLPYPDHVLIKTVNWGCNSRQESVPFSNEICEWVRRKYNLMNPHGPELPIKTPVIPEDFKVWMMG